VHRIWAYDLKTNASTETAYTATGGFWNGQTWTRDGETIYLATVNGELYKLDVETEVFTHLGHFLPKEEHGAGVRVDYLYGITLSAEEKRIYGIPRPSRSGGSNLYSYEIATGAITLGNWSQPSTPAATCVIRRVISTLPGLVTASLGKVKCAFPSCIPPDSRGNINLARFGDGEFWEAIARLAIVHPAGTEVVSEACAAVRRPGAPPPVSRRTTQISENVGCRFPILRQPSLPRSEQALANTATEAGTPESFLRVPMGHDAAYVRGTGAHRQFRPGSVRRHSDV
jgi:hypothetical protein